MADHNRAAKTRERTEEDARVEVESRLAVGIKESIVDTYEDLILSMWDKITPTLGTITVATIVQWAVHRTAAEHELIGLLRVKQDGVSFTHLKRVVADKDAAALKEGFQLLIANLFEILAKLVQTIDSGRVQTE